MPVDDISGSGAFAVVSDIAASWEDYARTCADVDAASTPGLILRAAGPTDEGIRTIEIWESELAWLRYAQSVGTRYDLADLVAAPVLRELRIMDLVHP